MHGEISDGLERCISLSAAADSAACLFGANRAYMSFEFASGPLVALCGQVDDSLRQKGCFQGLFSSIEHGQGGVRKVDCAGRYEDTCRAAFDEYAVDPQPFVPR